MFRLGENKPTTVDGVTMYLYENWIEDEEGNHMEDFKVKFVDDLTIQGPSLARRRLKMQAMGVPLMKLSKAFFFLGDLIKVAKPTTWFVDSNGKVFNYIKQTRAKLKFYKVSKLFNIDAGGVIIEAQGVPSRFKALFAPTIPLSQLYVGVLHLGMSDILYGFYDQKHTDTWRLV